MNKEAATKYIRNRLTNLVEQGTKSEKDFAERVTQGGVAFALNWFDAFLKDSTKGRVAANALELLDKGVDLLEVGQLHATEVQNELSYAVLDTSQMQIVGRVAKMQAMEVIAREIAAFDNLN